MEATHQVCPPSSTGRELGANRSPHSAHCLPSIQKLETLAQLAASRADEFWDGIAHPTAPAPRRHDHGNGRRRVWALSSAFVTLHPLPLEGGSVLSFGKGRGQQRIVQFRDQLLESA